MFPDDGLVAVEPELCDVPGRTTVCVMAGRKKLHSQSITSGIRERSYQEMQHGLE